MFVPAAGYLRSTVGFGTASDVFVAHGGWVGSWELWQLDAIIPPVVAINDRWSSHTAM